MKADLPPPEFSIVDGGPFNRLLKRMRLLAPPVENAGRRALVLSAFAWLPLALLSAVSGHTRAFFLDAATQVRLLVALPLLLLAERLVHARSRLLPARFLDGLVNDADLPAFLAALDGARRRRDGMLELWLLAAVVAARLFGLGLSLPEQRWATVSSGGATAAGVWYGAVCVPLYQFLLLRWLARLEIWATLLLRVSRLPLRLRAAHPDAAGGLGFLSVVALSFAPLLFSQSALLAAVFWNRLSAGAETAGGLERAAGIAVGAGVVLILGPLLAFTPALLRCRRVELVRYGHLSRKLVDRFEGEWLAPGTPEAQRLSLQDYGSVGQIYDVVSRTRVAPFGFETLSRLSLAAALPWLPVAALSGGGAEALKLLKGLVM